WWLAMDSNHPRRLYESRVLPTELASLVFLKNWLAGQDSNLRMASVTVTCLSSLATGQKAEGPEFWSEPSRMSEFRNRKWSDQSRGPSAIDAPSHDGFGLYRHFETEHSMLSARFSANNCSEVIRTFSLLDLP